MGSLAQQRVLIIDDEAHMRRLVSAILEKEEARVFAAGDGAEGLRKLYEVRPNLVILDVMMPGMDGWEVLRRIREMTDVPVIMLTVLAKGEQEARALRGGADDYITKPFDVDTLLARAEAALRNRGGQASAGIYDDGHLAFDRLRRRVKIRGKAIHLTRKEFELLDFLIASRGRVCTYDGILNRVWGGVSQGSVENVHVFIWQLRQKIEPEAGQPMYIINQPGVGYSFGGQEQ
ncbi:MAG: response regulator transcription factor [Candidatus Promineifilaceae bacterium]